MTFALAIGLLLVALKRARSVYAYLSGIVAGVSLYSYLGARVCVLSLIVYLFMEGSIRRERTILRHGIAFATGLSLVVLPLLCYYLAHPKVYAVRSDELSVFNSADWAAIVAGNIWRHALMFFIRGGVYARDNYPGLPMLDPLTAFVFVGGLVAALRRIRGTERLLLTTLLINFTGGLFSISQEGAPYVYRTAAVIIPVFAIVGLGLQQVLAQTAKFLTSGQSKVAAWSALLIVIALNFYLYFGLEPKNTAAMRVMAYEPHMLGLEIAQDDLPVFVIGRDIFDPLEARAPVGKEYAAANPPLILPPEIRKLATITFSGRYDLARTLTQNFQPPRRIYFVEPQALASDVGPKLRPVKMIFRPNREIEAALRTNDPQARIREIQNIRGETIFTIATLGNPPLSHRPQSASQGYAARVSDDGNDT